MSLKTKGGYCNYCEKNTMSQSEKPNHILHIILTLLTGGLWIIVWIILAMMAAGNYKCTQCGNNV